MTKAELKKYRTLVLEKEELEAMIASFSALKASSAELIIRSSGNGTTVERQAELLDNLTERYHHKLAEIAATIERIEYAVGTLEGNEKIVMRERYLLGHGWTDIAERLGYTERQVYRIHAEGLYKIARC